MHVLFETSSGYSLFEARNVEDIGKNLTEVQKEVLDLAKFGKRITLTSFLPFQNAGHALENINTVAEGEMPESLKSFLELSLPKPKSKKSSKSNVVLGVSDKTLAGNIKQSLGINCVSDDLVHELTRGIRYHCDKLLSQYITADDIKRSQLGLGHAFSRGKVAYNVNRSDNMIIQAIALCDQLDKDINLFAMRIKEWYSWHFPELSKIITDNAQYARLALAIRQRFNIQNDPSVFDKIVSIVNDSNVATMIADAAKVSMGMEIVDTDMANIDHFATKLIDLIDYRSSLGNYLYNKMKVVAPNLTALIGDCVGARLISQAGSLTNLAKYPASTVQILGAEKALFRALKTRSKTPKYGLIFHSTFIGKAGSRNKGRISRFLANKCSIASRLDSFSENPDSSFGDALRKQIEQRLDFFEGGPTPPSNQEVMNNVLQKLKLNISKDEDIEKQGAKKDDKTRKIKKDSKKKDKEDEDRDSKQEKKDKSKKEKHDKIKKEKPSALPTSDTKPAKKPKLEKSK